MSRELLVVAFHFPPLASSGTYRTLSFARHLARMGWRLTVVTVAGTEAAPRDEALLLEVPKDARVVRARSFDPVAVLKRILLLRRDGARSSAASTGNASGGGAAGVVTRLLQVPDRESPFQFTAAAAAVRAYADRDPPDAVFASGPPMSGLVAGALAARALGAPLVADLRDPWRANPFRSAGGAAGALDSLLERFVVASSSAIVANTPHAAAALLKAHPDVPEGRVAVIENGFDPDGLPRVEAPLAGTGPLTLLHAGVLYGKRDPGPLLRAIRAAAEGDPSLRGFFRVRFVGFQGDARFSAKRLAAETGGAADVSVEGSLPHAAALEEMIRADVLLLLGVIGAGPEVQVPAKLFEYLATGRPILSLHHPEGAIAAVLAEVDPSARVFPAPADDEAAIARALRDVAAARRGGRLLRGPSALPARFDRARQAERLDGILSAACYSRR